MEVNNKRHGKKSHKETQSPVLKVFQEMIQREKNDPEKANLLKDKQENKKRRQYSGSRSKSDRVQRSGDSSSCSEKQRRSVQYKVGVQEQRIQDYCQSRSRSFPFQGDKKDSWWFWGGDKESEENKQKKNAPPSDDTCSVSCALKKIVNSEYTCVACLGVVFLISVIVAFLVLFKAVPMPVKEKCPPKKLGTSEVLKKKIQALQKGYGGDVGVGDSDRRFLEDPISRHLSSLTGLHGNDFEDGSFRDSNNLEESVVRSDSELSGILDTEKLNNGPSSERLRNFYRKLIQTDNQIRNLKKGVSDYNSYSSLDNNKYNIERAKRSPRYTPKSSFRLKEKKNTNEYLLPNNRIELQKFNLFYPPYSAVNITGKARKMKRFANESDEPTGYLIEKKQIFVQYKPYDKKKVPKCSHAPKDSKSHEKQLKHPFYKNTQRLDEMLDQLLDKNLPELMSDPFGVNALFKDKEKFTHNTNVKTENINAIVTHKPIAKTKNKEDLNRISDYKQHKDILDKEFFDMVSSKTKKEQIITTSPNYDVLLSISTIVNPGLRKISKSVNNVGKTPSLLERVPHIRKLMQFEEEDEEGLGYEDLKEVLADGRETHDETDKSQERKKRMDDNTADGVDQTKLPQTPSKYDPPGVHNPNWKGSMPLYPDELTSMIKQVAMQNIHNLKKVHIPINTKDISSEVDSEEADLSDVEYVESYSDNKFEKLAKMAQAYSDYGVLEGKKETIRNDHKAMDGARAEHRNIMSLSKRKSLKNAFFNKFNKRKCTASEGIRFELKPTTEGGEDFPMEIMKAIQKHVKVTNLINKPLSPEHYTTNPTLSTAYSLFSIPSEKETNVHHESDSSNKKTENIDYGDSGVIFTIAKNGEKASKRSREDEIENDYDDKSIAFTFGKKSSKSSPEIKSNSNDVYKNALKIIKRSLKSVDIEGKGEFHFEENVNGYVPTRVTENYPLLSANDKLTEENINTKNGHNLSNTLSNYYNNESIIDAEKINHEHSKKQTKAVITSNDTDNFTLDTKNQGSFKGITQTLVNSTEDISGNVNMNAAAETLIKNYKSTEINNSIEFKDTVTKSKLGNVNASSQMDLSDFFMLMSNWFSLLAGFDTGINATTKPEIADSSIMKFYTKRTKNNSSAEIEYPLYDSDMIDNIGHRSRVLMTVEDAQDITTDVNEKNGSKETDIVIPSTSEASDKNVHATTNTPGKETNTKNDNLLTTSQSTTTALDKKKIYVKENKTIAKRNIAGDDNLIFWNDMYDDEYGIKQDPIDNAIREKHYIKGVDFMRKSGNWIQDKMKNLASNFRTRDRVAAPATKKRVLREAKHVRAEAFSNNFHNKYKRAKFDDDEAGGKPSSFADLTSKMKEVCKEAAKAVQQTKNVKVRQDEKEDTMTTSLMQQLVRLMTDLVDFQVQQKTCAKLPPDLQDFLEWLTAPNPEQMELRHQKMGYRDDGSLDKPTDQEMDLTTAPSSEKEEIHAESRSECLGTLHAVQDLMHQYDEMTDEDKSKMTGIREYLEDQLQFLHRQLNAFDEYKTSNMFEDQNPSIRYRRDLELTPKEKRLNRLKVRRKLRFKRKFFKNYGKKHTRTTASIYDGFPITENHKLTKHDITEENKENNNLEEKNNKNEKRNLKDVYYKALHDSKKSTTFKTVRKDDLEGFDTAQIVRIEN